MHRRRTEMKRYLAALMMAVFIMLAGVGCGGYYQVTDPTSGRTYYTTKVKEKDGRIEFKDAASGSTVRLHSSEVKKLSEDEYKAKTSR